MPEVSPEVIRWARETAGLSRADAARKLEIRASHGVSGQDRLGALESGLAPPSRPLLKRMARVYRRPLVALYLRRPPAKGERGDDFRTLSTERVPSEDALVDALLRDLSARQALVRGVLEDEGAKNLHFVGSLSLDDGVDALVASLRDVLQFDDVRFSAAAGAESAFSLLREAVEEAGVFVLLVGNLGTHHTSISLESFRGFALSDPLAPFVVVNDQDAHSAWSFTLLHELVHVWLGQTGISGANSELALERFCDDAASHFLLPSRALDGFRVGGTDDLADRVMTFAASRNLSGSMVAVRLFQAGSIPRPTLLSLLATFREQWTRNRDRQRQRDRNQAGGPNYYIVRRHRLGRALLDVVSNARSSGSLTTEKAARVLGVRPSNVGRLLYGASEVASGE